MILLSKGTSGSCPVSQFKSISSSALSLIYGPALTSVHDYGKNHSSDYTNLCQSRHYADFVGKVISLLFNMLSRLVITFLPRSKCLLTSWLQSLSAVILECKKRKSVTASIFFLSICHEVVGLDAMILVF